MKTTATPKYRRGIHLRDNLPSTEIPGPAQPPVRVQLADIQADEDVQPRANGLDLAYVAELAAQYHAGDELPPITLYRCPVSGLHWCADGFHRVAAAAQVGFESVPALVLAGGKSEAMRHAMGANATHGRRRTAADLTRCYRRAVAEQWVAPDDTAAVADLLKCSKRWASEITRGAREQANAERDAAIQKLADEGKNQRYIAGRVGVSPATVNAVLSVQKRKTSETEQAGSDPTTKVSSREETDPQEADESEVTAETTPEPPARVGMGDNAYPVKAPPAKAGYLKTHRSLAAHLRRVAAQMHDECSEHSRTPPAEVLKRLDDLRETAEKLSRSIAKLIDGTGRDDAAPLSEQVSEVQS